MKARRDSNGNQIGNGTYHVEHHVIDLSDYPQVSWEISKSDTTESVYVKYYNSDNGKEITVRFSFHDNNATRFGDQLNGNLASSNEILFRLGLKTREFIPNTFLWVMKKKVRRIDCHLYEESELTIQEMYALGAGADISAYTGKLAKGSGWLIQGTEVIEMEETKSNDFGTYRVGKYIYK